MIYFVQDGGNGPIKIGYTKNPKTDQRLSGLQVGNPRKLVVLHFQHGCEKTEAALHERFGYAKVQGEWFRPVPELLDHIDRMRGTKRPHLDSLLAAFLLEHELEDRYDGTLKSLVELSCFEHGDRPRF